MVGEKDDAAAAAAAEKEEEDQIKRLIAALDNSEEGWESDPLILALPDTSSTSSSTSSSGSGGGGSGAGGSPLDAVDVPDEKLESEFLEKLQKGLERFHPLSF